MDGAQASEGKQSCGHNVVEVVVIWRFRSAAASKKAGRCQVTPSHRPPISPGHIRPRFSQGHVLTEMLTIRLSGGPNGSNTKHPCRAKLRGPRRRKHSLWGTPRLFPVTAAVIPRALLMTSAELEIKDQVPAMIDAICAAAASSSAVNVTRQLLQGGWGFEGGYWFAMPREWMQVCLLSAVDMWDANNNFAKLRRDVLRVVLHSLESTVAPWPMVGSPGNELSPARSQQRFQPPTSEKWKDTQPNNRVGLGGSNYLLSHIPPGCPDVFSIRWGLITHLHAAWLCEFNIAALRTNNSLRGANLCLNQGDDIPPAMCLWSISVIYLSLSLSHGLLSLAHMVQAQCYCA